MKTCSRAVVKGEPTVVHLDASWAKGYSSVGALKQDADLAVDGTIVRTVAVTKDNTGLVFTDFALSVQAVAFNPRKAVVSKDKEIVIHQTGGTVGNTRYEVRDDPLFKVGDHAVLFLQQYSADHYFVIGGPTGRFTVKDGFVYPMSHDGVKFTGPTTEDEFLTRIRA